MTASSQIMVAWQQFAVAPGAPRVVTLADGRTACRAALARAAAAWAAVFGPAPWESAEVDHEPDGAPVLRAAGSPRISLCHTRGLAGCAIAPPGHEWVGIDAEPADAPGARAVRELAVRTGEAALPWTDDVWPSRLWCAKEAVVKAERTAADVLGQTLRVIEVLASDRPTPTPAAAAARASNEVAPDRPVTLLVRSHRSRVFRVQTWHTGAFVTASVLGAEARGPGAEAQ